MVNHNSDTNSNAFILLFKKIMNTDYLQDIRDNELFPSEMQEQRQNRKGTF